MHHTRYHVGLRTIKTALAVFFALTFVTMRGSHTPIFAGIGAIVAMSRTLHDAVRACLTQLAGITCGVLLGYGVLALLPAFPLAAAGIGVILVILCCNAMRIDFAIPLSCIVLVSVCLMPVGSDYIFYGLNRFLDTTIGLVTALCVNVAIKPYNNRKKIINLMNHIFASFGGYLSDRIVCAHYPDLTHLHEQMHQLEDELSILQKHPVICLTNRKACRALQDKDLAYLRGCAQLLDKMQAELVSLCAMDVLALPSHALCTRLATWGIALPPDFASRSCGCTPEDRVVLDFHLKKLLDAGDFFRTLHAMQAAPVAH